MPRAYLLYPDVLRILSTLFVVLLHVSDSRLSATPFRGAGWWVANLIDSATRFAVPIFVMISGMFLLDPAKSDPLGRFFAKRLSKVLVPLAAWSAIYYIWTICIDGKGLRTISLKALAAGTLSTGTYYHLWFMYMILGLYLATPVIKTFINHASRTLVAYFLVLWFLFTMIGEPLKWLGYTIGISNIIFSPFLGYFVLGHFLHTLEFRPKRLCLAGAPLVYTAGLLLTAAGHYYFVATRGASTMDNLFFSSYVPSNLAMAVAVFLFFKALDLGRLERHMGFIRKVGALTFGIYLVHAMVIVLVRSCLERVGSGILLANPLVGILILTACAYFVSLFLVVILKKIPLLHHLVP